MTIKFKVRTDAINKAFDVIDIVEPAEATKQGATGYLFVIRANGHCDIYSQNSNMVARAALAVTDVEGEGAFVYPPAFSKAFRHLADEEVISFEAGDREGKFYVNYETTSGSVAERPSIDPKNVLAFEDPEAKPDDLQFPAHLLKRSIDAVKGGMADLADSKANDACKGVQIFDASKPDWAGGDGTMFSSDGLRGNYFFCEAFKGKGLALFGLHLPKVNDFLGKCSGNVTFRVGANRSYLVDDSGRMIGWGHYSKTYPRFAYYEEENIQFLVDGDYLRRTLNYMVASLPPGKEKIRLSYEAEHKRLQFYSEEATGRVSSPYVGVEPLKDKDQAPPSFSAVVSIKHFNDLMSSLVCPQVTLKVRINAQDAKKMHFRIKEEFSVDQNGKVLIGKEGGVRCQLTRFIPSVPGKS